MATLEAWTEPAWRLEATSVGDILHWLRNHLDYEQIKQSLPCTAAKCNSQNSWAITGNEAIYREMCWQI